MADREVFVNAPLRIVALELRFPTTSRVLSRPLWDAFEQHLGASLPEVEVWVDDVESAVPYDVDQPVLRRVAENHKRAVTLHPGTLMIELADYRQYRDLVTLADLALQALDTVPGSIHYSRIGLRYINEVRVDPVEDSEWGRLDVWAPYINSQLLHRVDPPDGLCTYASRSGLAFHSLSGPEYVFLDHGIRPGGVVDPDGVLSLDPVAGPCFALDLDSFVPGSAAEPTATSTGEVLGVIDRLHDAVEAVFEWAITDQLKEEVLRVSPRRDDASAARGRMHDAHA